MDQPSDDDDGDDNELYEDEYDKKEQLLEVLKLVAFRELR